MHEGAPLTLLRMHARDANNNMQGLAKDLMTRAFPDASMPVHLTTSAACRTYYHYTPEQVREGRAPVSSF